MHCTAINCTVLHFTALYIVALHCTALHCTTLHNTKLEEVPVKWMDQPSATEMERGRASELDIQKSAKKHGISIEIDQM